MEDIEVTRMVERALWREDFDRALSHLLEQVTHLKDPTELAEMMGADWYHLNMLLCVASDALHLARDTVEFGRARPSLQ